MKERFTKITAALVALFCVMYSAAYTQKPLKNGADNKLSNAEKKEGYQLLFDGASTVGWRTYQGAPGSWSVAKGMLNCHKDSLDRYADLITDSEYENFELRVDWKIEPNANSGILYMVTEKYDQSFLSGPEYQLLDNEGYKGQIQDYQKTAANYAMEPPLVDAANPIGQWNHTVIIVNKGHVEHWLNAKKTVEYELWSDKWKAEKAHGKWKDAAGYGMSKSGHIGLQDYHGNGQVWFKNIKIKAL